MNIITSKVMIPQEVPLVCRQGVLDTLRENLNSCQVTVINGCAGTGKTMLAADFVRRHEGRAAWYKVDAPEMSLSVFMEYLSASMARVRPDFGCETLACQLQVSGEFNIHALAEAYAFDLERQAEPLILVIDDLHLVYDADWLVPFFHRLLPMMPTDIHMLILGRSMPPAPLWRLRSKQRLFVVTEQMLAFTQSESEELFFGYGLSAEDARVAIKQTGGRAADLHEAAIRASASLPNAGATI